MRPQFLRQDGGRKRDGDWMEDETSAGATEKQDISPKQKK
jgi:hypothetical protein